MGLQSDQYLPYSNSNWRPFHPRWSSSQVSNGYNNYAYKIQKTYIIVDAWMIIWLIFWFQILQKYVTMCTVFAYMTLNPSQLTIKHNFHIIQQEKVQQVSFFFHHYEVKLWTVNIIYLLGEELNGKNTSWHIDATLLPSVVWDFWCVCVCVTPSRPSAS